MPDLFDRKNRALNKHYESFRCTHAETALRKRIVRNGAVQYVHQCLRCGEACTNPISREKAIAQNGGNDLPLFSYELSKSFDDAREEGARKIIGEYESKEEFQRAEFHEWYAKYRESDEWAKIRAKVLKRANYVCEGCLEREAVLAHHTTYEHVGREFMFELLALCQPCHDRVHAEPESNEGEEGDA